MPEYEYVNHKVPRKWFRTQLHDYPDNLTTHVNRFLNDATPLRIRVDGISSAPFNNDLSGDDPVCAGLKCEGDKFGTGTGRRRGDAEGDGEADETPGLIEARGGGGGGGLFTAVFKAEEDDADRRWPCCGRVSGVPDIALGRGLDGSTDNRPN